MNVSRRARTGAGSFFGAAAAGAPALAVWAAHFVFCYTLAVIGCDGSSAGMPMGALRWRLAAGSAVAALVVAALLWRACRLRRRGAPGLLSTVRAAGAALALVGVAWTALPALLVAACPVDAVVGASVDAGPGAATGPRAALSGTDAALPARPFGAAPDPGRR